MNQLLKCVIFLLLLPAISGCLWPFAVKNKNVTGPLSSGAVSVGVLNPDLLMKGGKIYFLPFSAGVDAQAGEALDRLSLMMVKGASDALEEGGRFSLLPGDMAGNADITVKGRIETFGPKGGFRRGLFMAVRGEVRLVRTNETMALIYGQKDIVNVKNGADQAAYAIGFDIGKKLSQ